VLSYLGIPFKFKLAEDLDPPMVLLGAGSPGSSLVEIGFLAEVEPEVAAAAARLLGTLVPLPCLVKEAAWSFLRVVISFTSSLSSISTCPLTLSRALVSVKDLHFKTNHMVVFKTTVKTFSKNRFL